MIVERIKQAIRLRRIVDLTIEKSSLEKKTKKLRFTISKVVIKAREITIKIKTSKDQLF